MDDYRKDSLFLDFSGMPVRPKLDKVFELISKKINLDMTKVNCIQPSMTKARVIIELKSQSYVEELVAQHSSKHTVEHNNKQYAIPLIPFDNTIEVRVADLPSYVSTEIVSKHLAPYGEVVSTKEEVWKNFWPGLPTGVRLARMRIHKPIPSYIPVASHTAFITYRNQTRTCKYCGRTLHIGRSCNEARKDLGIDINNRLTAAQVVQGNIPPPSSASPNQNAAATSSSLPNTTPEMETSENENNPSNNQTLAPVTTEHLMAPPTTRMTRSSSANLLPFDNSQVAGTSRNNSPANIQRTTLQPKPINASEFEISDDADEEMTSIAAAKRQRPSNTPDINEAPFEEVKRKSRSRSKHHSSSR